MGDRAIYRETAIRLGTRMGEQGLGLVYGGGNVGLMGTIADAVLAAGGPVIGVIPDFLQARELAHAGLSELHLVKTMHQRKALMAEKSDAFIAMPGGFGTLEEFAEVTTWAQLGLHEKALGLLNVDGFYDPLLAFFDQAAQEGFIPPALRTLVIDSDNPDDLLTLVLNHQPRTVNKWAPPGIADESEPERLSHT